MRVKAFINVAISEDDDQLQKLDPDVDVTIDDSLPTGRKASVYTLAPASMESQYDFAPEVTNGKYLIVQVLEGEVTLKFNSNTAPGVGLVPDPATTQDPILPYQKNPQNGVLFFGPDVRCKSPHVVVHP